MVDGASPRRIIIKKALNYVTSLAKTTRAECLFLLSAAADADSLGCPVARLLRNLAGGRNTVIYWAEWAKSRSHVGLGTWRMWEDMEEHISCLRVHELSVTDMSKKAHLRNPAFQQPLTAWVRIHPTKLSPILTCL